MSKTPLLGGKKSSELAAAGAAIQPHGRISDASSQAKNTGVLALSGSDAGTGLSGGKDEKTPVPSRAKNTGGPVLSANLSSGERPSPPQTKNTGVLALSGSDAGTGLSGGKDEKTPAPSRAKNTGGPVLSGNRSSRERPSPPQTKNTGVLALSGSDAGTNFSGSQKQPAPCQSKNAGPVHSEENHMHSRVGTGVIIPQGQQFTADVLAALAMRLGGAQLAEAFAKSLPKKTKPVNNMKKRQSEAPAEIDLDIFRHQSRVFSMFSGHTSMAAAASTFSLAAERFTSGKRMADRELSKAGMTLLAAAHRSPPSEAIFATMATRLTGDAQLLLDSDIKPVPLRSRWRRWRGRPLASDASLGGAGWTSRMERLLAATISPPEPILPVHTANSKGSERGLIDKRQILYAVAVTLPVSLLASAAGAQVFTGQGAWVAGAGVCVWIIAAAGMILNQYGKLNWELLAARHLNRLCLIGGAILLSFYAFRAYFPSEAWAFWVLFGIAVTFLSAPWIMSMIRADDVNTASDGDTAEGSVTATDNRGNEI